MSRLRSSCAFVLCFAALGCGDPAPTSVDAGLGTNPDSSTPLVDPGTSLSTATDEGAHCLSSIVETDTGVAVIYRRYPLGGQTETVFARVAFDGTVEVAPVVLTNGTPSTMTLMRDGDGFMAVLGASNFLDLDANGTILSSSNAPTGNEPSNLQVSPAVYWTTYTSNSPFRANFVSYGPGRTTPSAAARLFPTTEEEQSGTKAAVVSDGVWVGYRAASRLNVGKVDLAGTEVIAPQEVINFPNTPNIVTITAVDTGVLVGARTNQAGVDFIHSFRVYDNSGSQIGERIDMPTLHDESPTDAATALGDTFFLVHERDLDGAFVRIAVERISATDASGSNELLTPQHFRADCPSATIAGGRLAVSYRAFDPAPVRRVRFYEP